MRLRLPARSHSNSFANTEKASTPECGASNRPERTTAVADETVERNLRGMDDLDFAGWNKGDWAGVFTRYHTDDVLVDVHGQASTRGIREHVEAMKAFVESTGGVPVQVKSHPIRFGSEDWT